ncbi:MAG: hypothetical protein QOI13_712 [Paraburkholderia sp.]|nr:hypothetical protein [Paraburkholderia sp.]
MAGWGNGNIGGCVRCFVSRGYGRFRMTADVLRCLRRRYWALAAPLSALALSACVTWVKPGVPPEVRDRDLAACHSFAYSRVPPDVRTVMMSPGFITPGTVWCTNHHYRHCRYIPGYYVPPVYSNMDMNDSERSAQIYNCMLRLGYVQKATL